jgi:hypothetical protein
LLSTLTLSGDVSASGCALTKVGQGTLIADNLRAASLTVSAGKVKISAKMSPNSPAGTSMLNSLSISPGASLDLTNNALVLSYTTLGTLLADIRQQRLDDLLITSLSAHGHALGYADNATLGKTIFGGQSVSPSSVLIGYTFAGDSNLDGVVNALDFNALSAGYGSGTVWTQGDFNYDGAVNTIDFSVLATNFNQALPVSPSAGLASLVPEPTSTLGALGLLTMMVRRRVAKLKV